MYIIPNLIIYNINLEMILNLLILALGYSQTAADDKVTLVIPDYNHDWYSGIINL